MRVFVTGAAGFVGRFLVARLSAAEHLPVGVESEHDVTSPEAMQKVLTAERPDAIVHLAALSSVAASFGDAKRAFEVNYLGTRILLQAAAEYAPDVRILLVGSGDVYGRGGLPAAPFREDQALRPVSPYARTKAAAERLGTLAAAAGQDVVRVRPFNHTGPGQRREFVAASFARQIAEIECGAREPLLTVGNLESVREFLDVRDVVDAYLALLDPSTPADIYNVASGTGMPIRALLDALLDIAGVEAEIRVDPALVRPTDALVGCPDRLRDRTGWRPRYTLRETLTDSLAYWRRELQAP